MGSKKKDKPMRKPKPRTVPISCKNILEEMDTDPFMRDLYCMLAAMLVAAGLWYLSM